MRKLLIVFGLFTFIGPTSFAADANDLNNVNYDEVRQNYRVYLQELKKLSGQYKEFTGEMRKIMQEEGFPVWDENSGGPGVAPPGQLDELVDIRGDGYTIQNREKDMTVNIELPGLKKDSIKVAIQDQKRLRVTGSRKMDNGEIDRWIDLPALGNEKGQKAKYEDGVLTITISKAPETKKEVYIPVK
jgi:HSP20 family molecular chaperone IbpA